jgi:hypothetical protein
MDKPIAAAHAVLTAEGDYRLGELNEGPYVDSTLIALQTPLVREAIFSKNDESTFCEPLLLLPLRSTLQDCGSAFRARSRTLFY